MDCFDGKLLARIKGPVFRNVYRKLFSENINAFHLKILKLF